MPSERRHLQHVKTEMKQHVSIPLAQIPVNESIRDVARVPTPQQIADQASPYQYVHENNSVRYYELTGKLPQDLEFGEIAVAYSSGYERLFIKNSSNEIVEFRPYKVDTSKIKMGGMSNDETIIRSEDGYCTITYPYDTIGKLTGVNPAQYSVCVVREIASGMQRNDAEIVFDNENRVLTIRIPSDDDFAGGGLAFIFIGSPYYG